MPQFDLLNNDPWATRHRAIGRFRRAVNKVILRSRADKKVPFLQKLVVGYKLGKAGKEFSSELKKIYDYCWEYMSNKILPEKNPPKMLMSVCDYVIQYPFIMQMNIIIHF